MGTRGFMTRRVSFVATAGVFNTSLTHVDDSLVIEVEGTTDDLMGLAFPFVITLGMMMMMIEDYYAFYDERQKKYTIRIRTFRIHFSPYRFFPNK